MKFTLLAVLVALSITLTTALVPAGERVEKRAAPDKPAATAPSTQAAVPVNKKCPISKDPVDPKGETFTYKGKTIGFCCPDCIAAFKKDPEKYMKDLK